MADHWVGVDLGSHVDFSAVSILTRMIAVDGRGLPRRDRLGDPLYQWKLRTLLRFPLRTSYQLIARRVAEIARMPELAPYPRVVCDATGVGTAILELARSELRHSPEIEVWGVTITSGERWRMAAFREISCSKVALIGAFAAAIHSGRLKVSRTRDGRPIPNADVFEKELAAFKVRTSKRSDAEIFGADAGKHDDMVLSVSLPVFAGGLKCMSLHQPDREGERAALAAEARAEQEALDREDAAMDAERAAMYEERRWQAFMNSDGPDGPWDIAEVPYGQ